MQTLTIEDHGAVRVVVLDRPAALNAFSAQLMDDLADAFIDAAADERVKVLVLTGAGRAFSAGADLGEMGTRLPPPKHGFAVMLDKIIDFPKPFMVAVNGIGVGIGATICGLADLVLMADSARLKCPFSSLGLTAEAASTVTFPRLMGRQQATWFLLASEWLTAEQCVAQGVALEAVPADTLMDHVMQRAQTLAALPLASLMMTKRLMLEPLREEMRAAIKQENAGLASLVGGPANKEALAAFAEKRAPDFSGV